MNERHAQWRTWREQGLTMQAIADRAGVSKQAVSQVVGGPFQPARHGTTYKYQQGCRCEICIFYQQARLAPQRPLPSHGTTARYRKGCRCEDCREANAEQHRQMRARARRRGRPFAHGTTNGYSYYQCRCDACRTANTVSNRAYKRRRRARERQDS